MKPLALIVDYGGVLTTSLQEALGAFAEAAGIELQDVVRAALGAYSGGEDALVTRFETGLIGEDEFARGLATRLNAITGSPVDPDGLVARMFGAVRLEESMLAAVAGARRAGLKTALLSNSWGMSLYAVDRLEGLFDATVISGQVGLRKPDPRIFELTVERLGVAPDRCVFVDDHPGHLAAAARSGLRTVLHRTPQETIAELEGIFGVDLAGPEVSGSS